MPSTDDLFAALVEQEAAKLGLSCSLLDCCASNAPPSLCVVKDGVYYAVPTSVRPDVTSIRAWLITLGQDEEKCCPRSPSPQSTLFDV
jgi:hypothetical protein